MNAPSASGAAPFGAQAEGVGRVAAPPPRLATAASPPALLASLRQLVHLRVVAIAGQATAVALALALGIELPVAALAAVIAALAVANVLTARRLQRGTPTTHHEVAGQLALDLVAFTLLLLSSGGTANPFVMLYLLHVVLIVLLLPWRLAVAGTLLVVAMFATTYVFATRLRLPGGDPIPKALLSAGLGVSFVLTAVVTAWFVGRVVATLREHDRLLAEAARRAQADEAVLRIGNLAAGAAHELGTPLTTMAVVVDEMKRAATSPESRRDAAILAEQIAACRQALANLGAAAGHTCAIGGGRAPLDAFLALAVERFRALRPGQPVETRWAGASPAPEIFTDASLQQAILILLNNAADASPHHVDVDGRWDGDWLTLTVSDRGSGVPASHLDKLGRSFFTTKAPGKGTGLGLVLASSTVARLGGTIECSNRPGGGLAATLRVPLRSLTMTTTP